MNKVFAKLTGKNTLRLTFLFIGLSWLTISCGQQDDKAPEDVFVIESSEECTKDLKDILLRDISASLSCLEDDLETFTTSVKLQKEGYIQREELIEFVRRFFPEDFELARDVLKLIYELNTLILDDPVDHLSIDHLSTIFKIATVVNQEGRQLKELLTGIDGDNYWSRRLALYQNIQTIGAKLSTFIVPINKESRKLDITDFLTQIKTIFEFDDSELNLDSINTYLFAKTLILGGERSTLTIEQTLDLLERASNIVILGFDGAYFQDKEFASKEEEYYFYFDVVRELKSHFYQNVENKIIMKHEDVFTILSDLFADEHDIGPIDESVRTLKAKLISYNNAGHSFKDLTEITDLLEEFAGMLYFNEITFKTLQTQLKSKKAITYLKRPSIPQYSVFSQTMLKKYWSQFTDIVYRYRYFYNDDSYTLYSTDYKRTAHGLNMTSMMRWGINKIVDVYGEKHPNNAHKIATPQGLGKVMTDGEGILKAFIYWPDDYEGFLLETITNSDLFQFQSNGDEVATTTELTEYLVSVLHSFKVADEVHDEMKKNCSIRDEDEQSFEVSCFRRYFSDIVFKRLKLTKYYPRLGEYLKSNGEEEIKTYLINVELFARYNPQDNIPITDEELTRLLVILSSLEGIYIKYDFNKNNILERNELDSAFLLFKDLIKQVVDLGSSGERLYKSIFLYLVKYMKEPNFAQLSWFHLFERKGDITSTRFNIAAILNSIL